MNEQLVTVVVPVYNVEKFLERCIKSIINQTYTNIEIILVNDGSTDGSLDICYKMSKQDKRIQVITQENQGLSEARNAGIRNANGKYICFIDSDDFIHKDYIKLLVESLINNDADISVCDFYYIDENNNMWPRKEKKCATYSNIEAIRDILCGEQNTEVMTWNKLYKLSLFKENNIYFPKGKLHEDNFTTYKLYYYAKKISLISDRLYYYMQRANSIMGSKFNLGRLDIYEAIKEAKTFFKERQINLDDELEAYEAIIKIYILDNMIRSDFHGKEKEELVNEFKKNKKDYLKNKYVSKILKLAIFCIVGNGRIYEILLSVYSKIKKIKNRRKFV